MNLTAQQLESFKEKYANRASPKIKFSGINPQYQESRLSSLLSPMAQ